MIENITNHLQRFDFDVRKSKDARFMDQKVTPDVLSIIADCVLNFDADRNIEFTKDDIWNDNYFNTNVKGIFNKPDAQNETTRQEYDKFTSQPLRTLAYSGVLEMRKSENKHFDNAKMPKCENAKIRKFKNSTMPKCQNVKMQKSKMRH